VSSGTMSRHVLAQGQRLLARLVLPQDLAAEARAALYGVLEESFSATTREAFERDLDEKDWVLLLEERESGRPAGFSTQKRLALTVDGEPLIALFSGDTILRRQFWGEPTLARAWARLAFDLAEAERPLRTFWFLISSGYKTYRFLPVFFRSFHPRRGESMPAQTRRILDAFAAARYPREYDALRGVVRFDAPTPLRAGVADVTAERLADPDVAFFVKANPGHTAGDELACLTELVPDNLTRAGRRMLLGPA
jgi:hypothetical protein